MTAEVILQVLVLGFAALLCKEFLPLTPLVLFGYCLMRYCCNACSGISFAKIIISIYKSSKHIIKISTPYS